MGAGSGISEGRPRRGEGSWDAVKNNNNSSISTHNDDLALMLKQPLRHIIRQFMSTDCQMCKISRSLSLAVHSF